MLFTNGQQFSLLGLIGLAAATVDTSGVAVWLAMLTKKSQFRMNGVLKKVWRPAQCLFFVSLYVLIPEVAPQLS